MLVVIPAERRSGEQRVAAVPDTVRALCGAGFEVVVEAGAGLAAQVDDESYRVAGATISDSDPVAGAELVLSVRALEPERTGRLALGATTISLLSPTTELDVVRALRDQKITAFSLDLLPRISRAQSMDARSSQALVAGYRAVLIAADRLPRFFPLFMTAAGTVPPARVLVLGAGVAGLQAIATARRLGARVEAYDVRAAAGDEVRSLGAIFLELGLETQEGDGGYAREQSDEFLRRQRELIGARVAAADVVITTAAIPGRTAPILVTADMVDRMAPGSVVVDLAAESGGNCELSVAGQETRRGTVVVYGAQNIESQLAADASRLYARNVTNLLTAIGHEGAVEPDFTDEIVDGCCVTHDGEVRHEPTRVLLGAS